MTTARVCKSCGKYPPFVKYTDRQTVTCDPCRLAQDPRKKQCNQCGEVKSISEFGVTSKGVKAKCKKCMSKIEMSRRNGTPVESEVPRSAGFDWVYNGKVYGESRV
jgi:hypothetical protein